jgi:hypothetical protein
MEAIKKYAEIFQLALALALLGDITARLITKPGDIRVQQIEAKVDRLASVSELVMEIRTRHDDDIRRIDRLETEIEKLKDENKELVERIYKTALMKNNGSNYSKY